MIFRFNVVISFFFSLSLCFKADDVFRALRKVFLILGKVTVCFGSVSNLIYLYIDTFCINHQLWLH